MLNGSRPGRTLQRRKVYLRFRWSRPQHLRLETPGPLRPGGHLPLAVLGYAAQSPKYDELQSDLGEAGGTQAQISPRRTSTARVMGRKSAATVLVRRYCFSLQ